MKSKLCLAAACMAIAQVCTAGAQVSPKVDQNFDAVITIDFPLQYLRFFRMLVLPDQPHKFTRYVERMGPMLLAF